MSQIPITREYAAAVGPWCEQVESRSLLLAKFAFPKLWGEGNKENSASFWSLMRIASNGSTLLQELSEKLANPGRNVAPDKAERMRDESKTCRALANTKTGSNLEKLRAAHTNRFLELLRSSYSAENLRITTARLEGRLAINLAEGLVQNGGLNLDRIFGLPLINGSSVKGVARSAALAELKAESPDAIAAERDKKLETFVRVFGVAENDWRGDLTDFADLDKGQGLGNKRLKLPLDLKGAIVFFQATPTNDAKIVVDITNVHTPDFYRTGNERDLANERPTPNYFPVVERGAEFAFPILLNNMSADHGLLAAAERWLSLALEQRGLGAKTAAGYGWFTDTSAERRAKEQADAKADAEKAEAERAAKEQADAKAAAFAALTPEQKIANLMVAVAQLSDEEFAAKVKAIATLPDEEQRAIIRLFSENKEKRKKLKNWRDKKPDNVKPIEAAATRLGEKLP